MLGRILQPQGLVYHQHMARLNGAEKTFNQVFKGF